jgi:hypothetical protein
VAAADFIYPGKPGPSESSFNKNISASVYPPGKGFLFYAKGMRSRPGGGHRD